MTIFGIIKELCKDALGILLIAICIRAAYEMLMGLKRALFPEPFDPAQPARYRLRSIHVTAHQLPDDNWEVTEEKENGNTHTFTVLKNVFPTIYELSDEDDE